MATRRKRLTNEELIAIIINKMFEISEHNVTFNDIKDRKDNWYQQWTMTVEQNEEWKRWMVGFLRKERGELKMANIKIQNTISEADNKKNILINILIHLVIFYGLVI